VGVPPRLAPASPSSADKLETAALLPIRSQAHSVPAGSSSISVDPGDDKDKGDRRRDQNRAVAKWSGMSCREAPARKRCPENRR
jgi:hypothetical protein